MAVVIEKDRVISDIIFGVAEWLEPPQLDALRSALHVALFDYDLHRKETCKDVAVACESNRAYMLFFVAKKIEGCSERSLKYYKYTVDAFREFIGKNLTDITTDDIRFFLAKCGKTMSGVSLNNMRRNLSSFFAWLTPSRRNGSRTCCG